MEIKINKDIRQYSEQIFFGLSLRQCIFVALGIAAGLFTSIFLYGVVPLEFLSLLCVFIAAPFAGLGFIHYNGMSLEKLIAAYFTQNGMYARPLVYKAEPYYLKLLSDDGNNDGNAKKKSGRKEKKDV
jgi:hypothetical protein